MDTATIDRRPKTDRFTSTMTVEQRQSLIEWAWYYARPVIFNWNRLYFGPDYKGSVAERFCKLIDTFDAGQSTLKKWAQAEANFACMDADREETGVIRIGRRARERTGGVKVRQLQALEVVTDNGRREPHRCLDVRDQPGHLDQIDAFRGLIRGCNRTERLLLIGYYWQGRTMKEIGADLDLSESRVSQLHSDILDRLRERLTDRAPAA